MNSQRETPHHLTERQITGKTRVLIADDHATFVVGLTTIVNMQSDMMVVGEAYDGREAVALWEQWRPDVTLFDLRMPKLDGVGAIEEIRRRDVTARIVILTTYDSDNEI